ncbi:hypothetical protein CISG_01677 [Coccidioides immitis RMSCC 3703]|uniref:Uncharacterized protein n=2 Tax=Coccidioides immitis TaxID=5501 RepID=A0A0J8TXF6_COCIT|nr:hypothetical protein CIRG_08316 [Coccidioides immitis RMSCC 2394]KMU78637.1 hypothetical protein CISG_01677 [Coccidioides immitis RMSCC 3703]
MTRPQISRAETADLQESLSPSPHGRHQDQALRNAERDTPDEIADLRRDVHHRIDEEYNYSDQDDPDHLNGLHGDRMGGYQQYLEEDAADDDMDDHLDDDMLDKISSSPSIDDVVGVRAFGFTLVSAVGRGYFRCMDNTNEASLLID